MEPRRLGPSRTGTTHWWRQRLTAVALAPLAVFLVGLLPVLATASHAEFVAIMRDPVVPTGFALLLAAGLYHMQLGLEVVIEDYARGEALRTGLRIALTLTTCLLAAAGIVSVVMLAA